MTSLANLFQEVENACCSRNIGWSETEDAYQIEALVAGIKPQEIEIAFENNALTIEAKSDRYRYSYLVPLPSNQIESDKIEATSVDGILKLTLPKAKSAKPTKITVKTI